MRRRARLDVGDESVTRRAMSGEDVTAPVAVDRTIARPDGTLQQVQVSSAGPIGAPLADAPPLPWLPVLAAPERGKAEQPVEPPIRCFVVKPDGSLLPAQVVGVECDSGVGVGPGEMGRDYRAAARGKTLYQVRSDATPECVGTFGPESLRKA